MLSDENSKIYGYWFPHLSRKSFIFEQKEKLATSQYKLLLRFFHLVLYYFPNRLVSIVKTNVKLVGVFRLWRQQIREKIIFWLISRKGTSFRQAAHASILGLSCGLLFLGSAGGNLLLGRGQVHGYVLPDDETVKRVVITKTDVPGAKATDQIIEYTVKEGDTLSGIGEKFRISSGSIQYSNNITNENAMQIGQKLTIPPIQGVIVKVASGDTVESLAKKFNVPPQVILDFNYLKEPYILEIGTEIVIPDAQVPTTQPQYATTPSGPSGRSTGVAQQGISGSGNFGWPTDYRYITQYFSSYHPAIDIAKASPLYAADGGTVIEAVYSGWNWGYGKYVVIDHGNGYQTKYAHMSEIYVGGGDVIERGQSIGMMGSTGRSSGTHVHFEVQYYGQYVNPLSVL